MFRRSEGLEISLVFDILATAYRPRSAVVPRDGVRSDNESDFRYLT
jgi:hypothetical protein